MTAPSDAGGGPPPPADLDSLHREFGPAVHAWAVLRTQGRLRAYVGAEDLAQEVWLRAARAFAGRGPGPVRAWLFTIAKHVLYEARRHADRAAALGQAGGTTRLLGLQAVPDAVTSLTRALARDDAIRAFLARAEALDDDDRLLLLHLGLEGMPAAEVAARLALAPAAVHKRWQRLRERLRDWPAAAALLA